MSVSSYSWSAAPYTFTITPDQHVYIIPNQAMPVSSPRHLPSVTAVHRHEANASKSLFSNRVKKGIDAGVFVLAAALLKIAPLKPIISKSLIPITADWKKLASIFLAISAVNKANEAFKAKPKPWVQAVEAVGLISLLNQGFTKQGLLQFGIVGAIVTGAVQLAQVLNNRLTAPLKQKYNIDPTTTHLAVSLGIAVGSIAVLTFARQNLLKLFPKGRTRDLLTTLAGTAGISSCACQCPGVCMSELASMIPGLKGPAQAAQFEGRKQ